MIQKSDVPVNFDHSESQFLEWLKQNNILWDASKLDILARRATYSNRDHYYCMARDDIPISTVICTIPKDAILSAKNTVIAHLIENQNLIGAPATIAALMFERALKERSRFWGYLQFLPNFEPLPCTWTETEKFLLKGTALEHILQKDLCLMRDDYKECIEPMIPKMVEIFNKIVSSPKNGMKDCDENSKNEHDHNSQKKRKMSSIVLTEQDACESIFSFSNFKAAATIVASRAFFVDSHHGDALVPIADIFNHRTFTENVHIEGDDDSQSEDNEYSDDLSSEKSRKRTESPQVLSIVVVREGKKDTELFNTYGQVSNLALLAKYGFCERFNSMDTCNITTEMVYEAAIQANISSEQIAERFRLMSKILHLRNSDDDDDDQDDEDSDQESESIIDEINDQGSNDPDEEREADFENSFSNVFKSGSDSEGVDAEVMKEVENEENGMDENAIHDPSASSNEKSEDDYCSIVRHHEDNLYIDINGKLSDVLSDVLKSLALDESQEFHKWKETVEKFSNDSKLEKVPSLPQLDPKFSKRLNRILDSLLQIRDKQYGNSSLKSDLAQYAKYQKREYSPPKKPASRESKYGKLSDCENSTYGQTHSDLVFHDLQLLENKKIACLILKIGERTALEQCRNSYLS